MQNLTDHTSVEKYSEEFSDIILNNFFNNKEHINGQEILELTPVRQVNLFVLKSLLFKWKKESEKLKSEYFDFANEEVQKALSTFMNTVSRHILVDKKNLRPLLVEASCDSILLIFFPYVYYTNLINNWNEDHLQLKDLRQINKYIKVNGSLMNSLITELETKNLVDIEKNEALALLNNIVEHSELSPADTDVYEQQFNQVLTLQLNAFLKNGEVDETDKAETTSSSEPAPEVPSESIPDEPIPIHEKLQQKGKTTLADMHEKQKIERISKYISINQKFMFINQLFDKDWGKFEKAISFLDETNDKGEISRYLDENAPTWRDEGEEAEEFRLVLEKKLGEPIE
jgi:uncharacterized protein YozE (UPF0346 family)